MVLTADGTMAAPKKIMPRSVIDNQNTIEPVVDYSFCRLASIADCLEEEPRNNKEVGLTPRQPKDSKQDQAENDNRVLSRSRCFFLNNNSITEIADLRPTMEGIFENVDNVAWLNLSFNEITTLDPIVQLPNLEILYLHGNAIADLAEVEKLGALTKLRKATLHGNPIENQKGYRQFVLANLLSLRVLDFSNVTREDRTRVQSWKMVNKSKKKKVVEEDE